MLDTITIALALSALPMRPNPDNPEDVWVLSITGDDNRRPTVHLAGPGALRWLLDQGGKRYVDARNDFAWADIGSVRYQYFTPASRL